MQITVEKRTGTYADALEAIGWASLLAELGFEAHGVRIVDKGPYFMIETKTDIPPDKWQAPDVGYPYIWECGKEPKPPCNWILDYQKEKDKRQAYQKARERSGRKSVVAQQLGGEDPSKPVPELELAIFLANMRKGWKSDKELAKWISQDRQRALEWVKVNLKIPGASVPNELPKITNSQMLNPISGKGIHVAKTQWKAPAAINETLIDGFAEWMKLRGLFRAMLPFRNRNDFKFFVIEPADISIADLESVRAELSNMNLWGGIRLDIHATLRCAEVLIMHLDRLQSSIPRQRWMQRMTPRSIITGLRQAYFMSLGQAAALMNEALFPLPDWFNIKEKSDADAYLEIIGEAIGRPGDPNSKGCLSSLKEDNSDEGRILQQYRQWLLTGDLFELLEFHYQFAVHGMQKEAVKKFSTQNLTMLITKSYSEEYPMLKEIVENSGFQSVARAIRNCTIYARSLDNREVRFGLAQQLKQKIKGGNNEFAAALSEFVQDQNWEVQHKLNGKGHMVSVADLNAVLSLIDKHGAELVGSLLLAYGYAQAEKVSGRDEKDEGSGAASATENGNE
ncbi:MAG TPA: hypothetical protein VKV18_01660 [Chthonomonas sp.]|uniref:hypothetical protein n=1 Tax=Chthonomonas sp. TaxID=2282153 RepID=UPI002B4B4569|nr:hypothetical protein [Chthonomonas sp.]HLI47383.1 hypothetical protein [Chthonomonas sp.]